MGTLFFRILSVTLDNQLYEKSSLFVNHWKHWIIFQTVFPLFKIISYCSLSAIVVSKSVTTLCVCDCIEPVLVVGYRVVNLFSVVRNEPTKCQLHCFFWIVDLHVIHGLGRDSLIYGLDEITKLCRSSSSPVLVCVFPFFFK